MLIAKLAIKYTCVRKMVPLSFCLSCTLSNAGRFSKFFNNRVISKFLANQ